MPKLTKEQLDKWRPVMKAWSRQISTGTTDGCGLCEHAYKTKAVGTHTCDSCICVLVAGRDCFGLVGVKYMIHATRGQKRLAHRRLMRRAGLWS